MEIWPLVLSLAKGHKTARCRDHRRESGRWGPDTRREVGWHVPSFCVRVLDSFVQTRSEHVCVSTLWLFWRREREPAHGK